MKKIDSTELFKAACQFIPGGVNSPVRAFNAVGGTPVFFERAEGAYLFDVSGKAYIDYVGSWGPAILGHAHPTVVQAVQAAAALGLSFGAPTPIETDLAKLICTIMPNIQKIRFVSSGTEATMSAVRLARGFTGRDKIIKFSGCYHGHADFLLVKAGSGALTFGQPSSAGVTKKIASDTLIADFNDINSVATLLEQNQNEVAAILVEPIAGNMNCIPPEPFFLRELRNLCDHYGSLLIFDEVMTGFRVSLGGAQEKYQVRPDLTALGKIIGGGMPVGAFGGRQDIMDYLSPLGPVYQAGTLSGNPISMTAGLTTISLLRDNPKFYETLAEQTEQLLTGLRFLAEKNNLAFLTQHVGSMFGLFFTEQHAIRHFNEVMLCKKDLFNQFFHGMLEEGVYLAPSAFEAGFLSIAHNKKIVEQTLGAAEKVMSKLKRDSLL